MIRPRPIPVLVGFLLFGFLWPEWAWRQGVQVQLVEDPSTGWLVVEASGIGLGPGDSSARQDLIRVYPEETACVAADLGGADWPSMSGTVRGQGQTWVFVPRYPLQAGLAYRVRLKVGGDGTIRDFRVVVPSDDDQERVRVEEIFPSGDEVPANLLRFYIHFSAPVRPWDPYRHIELVEDATGRSIVDAFHQVRDGLWDPSRRRFTLLLEPGRIKRGLVPHREMGPPLQPGKSYRLTVRSTWPDLRGRPLAVDFVKRFRTVEDDRVKPDLARWRVTPPEAGSRQALQVEFGESLDRALLRSALTVLDEDGGEVAGEPSAGEAERTWLFSPQHPWRAGRYSLRLGLLEDLAGNGLDRLFDVDLQSSSRRQRAAGNPSAGQGESRSQAQGGFHRLEFSVAKDAGFP